MSSPSSQGLASPNPASFATSVAQAHDTPRFDWSAPGIPLIALAATIWFVAAMWVMRFHQLDDALITLRYAEQLDRTRRLTFNGNIQSYGVSSLLYVGIVASVYAFWQSVFVTKVLSVIFYALTCIVVTREASRAPAGPARTLWWWTLAVLLSPTAMRWLSDGMETSLTALAALIVTRAAYTCADGLEPRRHYLAMAALGAAAILLRLEFCAIIGCATGAILLSRWESAGRPGLGAATKIALPESHLAVGGILALAAIRLGLGQTIPDTAIAKSVPGMAFTFTQYKYYVTVFAGAFSLGIGLPLIWIISAIAVCRVSRGIRLVSIAIVNASFPILILAALERGQIIQIRYFVAPLLFMVAWNLFALADATRGRPAARAPAHRRRFAIAAAVVVCVFTAESMAVHRIIRDRSQVLLAMRAQHLDLLADKRGMAWDIGFISYFSHAQLCDMAGLTGGRAWAQDQPGNRAKICAAWSPDFVFLNPEQIGFVTDYMALDSMLVCHQYRFQNMLTTESHYLLVKPEIASELCPDASSAAPLIRTARAEAASRQ
ncbi:MAG TPA: hypothetical protein VIX59_21175 [Candidatus Binataceae bacterium]